MTEHTTEQAAEQATEQPAAPARELISRREYGRRKGWAAPSYVVELCQDGKIPLFAECPACAVICNVRDARCACGQAIAGVVDTKRAKIDPVEADRALAAARHPEKTHVAQRHADARGEGAAAGAGEELPLDAGDPNVASYAAAKAKREHFAAETARLEYERRIGQLGDLEAMRREMFEIARQVRDSLCNIPDRLAPVLAAEREEARVHHLLLVDITQVCDELYRTLGTEPGDPVSAAG
jgi:hypothetical protein